uniref:Leucine-rich repeat-containing protein 24 n=1 Tax=Hirondellea gigas TaxID=1518452 RepID=A0A6A7FYE6_9CRUS
MSRKSDSNNSKIRTPLIYNTKNSPFICVSSINNTTQDTNHHSSSDMRLNTLPLTEATEHNSGAVSDNCNTSRPSSGISCSKSTSNTCNTPSLLGLNIASRKSCTDSRGSRWRPHVGTTESREEGKDQTTACGMTWSWGSRSSSTTVAVLLLGLLVMSLVLPTPVAADWDSSCPGNCRCTYVSNKKVAKCDNAGYTTVPSSLSPEIQVLVLSNNNIMQIDKDEFQRAGLVNLQRLVLANNKISYVDKDAFSGLHIMIELDLRNNRIEKLHPATFTGMEKLRNLYLNGNAMRRLEANQFPMLFHLQKLQLDTCNINYVHNYAFVNLPNITNLGLANNVLETVDAELFSNNPKLVSLELANNRWNCDCRLRNFARWLDNSERLKMTNWNCFAPDRLKNNHWNDVPLDDYACGPRIGVEQDIVSVNIGSETSLNCWATGDPYPALRWMAEKKILSNMTAIGDSTDHYSVYTIQNDTGVYTTLRLGVYGDHHPTEYTCLASNAANSVEKQIKVVVGSADPLDVTERTGPNIWILIGVGVALIVLIALLIVLIVCCWCRKKSSTAPHKLNGSAGEHGNVLVVAPSNSINPVGKPPRQYEKLPQKDVETTLITNTVIGGGHKSYEELNYPNNKSTYVDQRQRLPPLEEEGTGSLLPSSPYLLNENAPSPTLTLQSNMTQTTTGHFPDLLDNARVPRTISPTQLSYQSLAYPPLGQEWRFSYAHPADYNSGEPADYARSPVAYSTPQHQRPGYVTLPRRPRTPSWSGVPTAKSHIVANPLLSPSVPPREIIYDTLGPRTTADGTSTTDLTRPGSRAALYEPLPPSGIAPQVPTSSLALAAHYNSKAAMKFSPRHLYQNQARPGTSQTLPRSTPNLLDDTSLSIPQYRPARNTTIDPYHNQLQVIQQSEIDPLIEDAALGITCDPSYNQYNTTNIDEPGSLLIDDYNSIADEQGNNNNSENNYKNVKSTGKIGKPQLQTEIVNINLKAASPSVSPADDSSNRTLNSSVSPGIPSPAPTPTQILTSASHQGNQTRASPSSTTNNNSINTNGVADDYATSPNGVSFPKNDSVPSLSPTNLNNSNISSVKKKIPPRPPPKPSSKRLSVASMTSDSGALGSPRKASVTSPGQFQDEGPDGSEV